VTSERVPHEVRNEEGEGIRRENEATTADFDRMLCG
jgi:hypothetical protein